jgi:hypothetical protein
VASTFLPGYDLPLLVTSSLMFAWMSLSSNIDSSGTCRPGNI